MFEGTADQRASLLMLSAPTQQSDPVQMSVPSSRSEPKSLRVTAQHERAMLNDRAEAQERII